MKKEDERILKSKKFLKKALLTLLEEEKLSNIRVSTLCNKAEINRTTFYAHYKDVLTLFKEIMNEFISHIYSYILKLNEAKTKEESQNMALSFIKYIDDNSDTFLLIFENSTNEEVVSEQYELLIEKINKRISEKYDKKSFTKYITNYYLYAGGAILHTWIKNGKKEAHQDIAFLMLNLINKGASYYTII